MGSMSILHWLLVMLVLGLFFGTDRLRNMGRDLGVAFRQFKEGLNDGESSSTNTKANVPNAKDDAASAKEGATNAGDNVQVDGNNNGNTQ